MYLGKSCTLQWIPAHVDVEGIEMADFLASEARTLEPLTSSTMVFDAKAVAKQKLCSNPIKKLSLPELNYSREITSTITRLRTKHFKGMKILPMVQDHMWNAGTAQACNCIPNIFLAVLPLLVPFLK
ncbi:RNase H domain-containing protein [Trichonephila clavipes]|nr:RNase H domain-containing protein [Trichonephila clavipes]